MISRVHKDSDSLYTLNSQPPWLARLGLALTYLIKFSTLLLVPIIIGDFAKLPNLQIIHLMSISLIGGAITTLLVANQRLLKSGYFLPGHASITYFAILAIAAKTGGLAQVLSTTVLLGIFQFLSGFLLRKNQWVFRFKIAGFTLTLIGIWIATLGINELFHSRALGQLIIHSSQITFKQFTHSRPSLVNLALGIFTVFITLFLLFTKKQRTYCLLIGMLVGWGVAGLFGWIDHHKLLWLHSAPWFTLPIPFLKVKFQFTPNFILPSMALAFLGALETFAAAATIQYRLGYELSMKKIRHINWASSIGTLLSGLMGGVAQSPATPVVPDFILTNAYSRYIAYPYAAGLILLSFSPKIMFFFLTIPSGVNAAIIILMGAVLLMQGFKMLAIHNLSDMEARIAGIAFLVAIGALTLPVLYKAHYQPWMAWFTNRALISGFLAIIVLTFLFQIKFKRSNEK